jgi:hypothetical protein
MLAHSLPRIQSLSKQAGYGREATFPSDNMCSRRFVLPAGHISFPALAAADLFQV